MKETIAILNCGWLGLPLAIQLQKLNYRVIAGTRQTEQFSDLKSHGLIPSHVSLIPETQNISKNWCDASILIITLPFKRTFQNPGIYLEQLKTLVPYIQSSTHIKKIIFTSSTSIYPQSKGNFNEKSEIDTHIRAKILFQCEKLFLDLPDISAIILRLGGLIGPNRQLNTQKPIKKNKTLNLIHLTDCVNIIVEMLNQEVKNEIYNVVSNEHPKKSDKSPFITRLIMNDKLVELINPAFTSLSKFHN